MKSVTEAVMVPGGVGSSSSVWETAQRKEKDVAHWGQLAEAFDMYTKGYLMDMAVEVDEIEPYFRIFMAYDSILDPRLFSGSPSVMHEGVSDLLNGGGFQAPEVFTEGFSLQSAGRNRSRLGRMETDQSASKASEATESYEIPFWPRVKAGALILRAALTHPLTPHRLVITPTCVKVEALEPS